MKTFIEGLFEAAVAANSPVIPVGGTCETVITGTGSTRLSSENPEAFKSLAMTALQGYSAKVIGSAGAGSVAGLIGLQMSLGGTVTGNNRVDANTTKAVGLLVTLTGARNTQRLFGYRFDFAFSNANATAAGASSYTAGDGSIGAITSMGALGASNGTAENQTIVVYPRAHRAQFLLITTLNNGGIGQVSAGVGPQITSYALTNGTAANEYAFTVENVSLRDFTSRSAR